MANGPVGHLIAVLRKSVKEFCKTSDLACASKHGRIALTLFLLAAQLQALPLAADRRPAAAQQNISLQALRLIKGPIGLALKDFDPFPAHAVIEIGPAASETLIFAVEPELPPERRVRYVVQKRLLADPASPPQPVALRVTANHLVLRATPGFYTISAFVGTRKQAQRSAPVTITVSVVQADQPPADIPGFADWESNMIRFGRLHCNKNQIDRLGTWEGNVWYYDGIRVFYQIADYTNDRSWERCARWVREVYRSYVMQNDGMVGGWRVFADGLSELYWREADRRSRRAALRLATHSNFANSEEITSYTVNREVAFLMEALLRSRELGRPQTTRLTELVQAALGHLDQWTLSESSLYVHPFQVAVTSEALIRYNSAIGDARILPAISRAANWLWENAWDPERKAFVYVYCRDASISPECSKGPAPDLNLLIAPLFGWLYHETGAAIWRERGDQIFAQGVSGAWLDGGKQFNQNYRWSFDYIRWRTAPRL